MSAIENACNGGILYGTTNRRRCINDFLVHAHRTLQAYFFEFIKIKKFELLVIKY